MSRSLVQRNQSKKRHEVEIHIWTDKDFKNSVVNRTVVNRTVVNRTVVNRTVVNRTLSPKQLHLYTGVLSKQQQQLFMQTC